MGKWYKIKLQNLYLLMKKSFSKEKFLNAFWLVWSICSIISLYLVIFPITNKINDIQSNLNQQQSQSTILSYFSFIEEWSYEKAFNLFSDNKKAQHTLTWFIDWANDFVAFEGLKISELPEKNSANSKVFLLEYRAKKRGMLANSEIWIFFVVFNSDKNKWEINYSNVLYDDNWWRKWACDYYKFDHCK